MQKYRPRYKRHEWQGKEIGTKIIDASEMVKLLGLPHIYKQYMERKKFKQDYDPFAHYHLLLVLLQQLELLYMRQLGRSRLLARCVILML